tara:strand:- start:556 stop:843 length:288 start_codon:yes stop_codon:yes gene_type:complete
MLKIKVKDYEDIDFFLKNEKEQFFNEIIYSIKKAWKEKVEEITVVQFNVGSETLIELSINQNDWSESLHLALYHYESVEKYEKCVQVKKMIDEIL